MRSGFMKKYCSHEGLFYEYFMKWYLSNNSIFPQTWPQLCILVGNLTLDLTNNEVESAHSHEHIVQEQPFHQADREIVEKSG